MKIRCYNPQLTNEDNITLVENLNQSSLRVHFESLEDKIKFVTDIQDDGYSLSGLSGDRSPEGEWADIYFDNIDTYNSLSNYLKTNYEVIVIPSPEYNLTWTAEGKTIKTQKLISGKAITAEDMPTKTGYEFKWNNYIRWMQPMDYTIEGEYVPNVHTVNYIIDGQTYKSQTVRYGESIPAISDPIKVGYTFSGWTGIPTTMPDEDITVTGSWTINQYVLTFQVDGQTYDEDIYNYKDPIVVPDAPTKEGYRFVEWQDLPKYMPALNLTVIAIWEKVE